MKLIIFGGTLSSAMHGLRTLDTRFFVVECKAINGDGPPLDRRSFRLHLRRVGGKHGVGRADVHIHLSTSGQHWAFSAWCRSAPARHTIQWPHPADLACSGQEHSCQLEVRHLAIPAWLYPTTNGQRGRTSEGWRRYPIRLQLECSKQLKTELHMTHQPRSLRGATGGRIPRSPLSRD